MSTLPKIGTVLSMMGTVKEVMLIYRNTSYISALSVRANRITTPSGCEPVSKEIK